MPARTRQRGQRQSAQRELPRWPVSIPTVQPAASAGATLRVIIAIGKFHGVIAASDAHRLLQRDR
jgi:hypothetical protein